MSARAPFFPAGPLQPAQTEAQSEVMFKPDLSNALLRSVDRTCHDTDGNIVNRENVQKISVSGLGGARRGPRVSNGQTQKELGASMFRPSTADPHAKGPSVAQRPSRAEGRKSSNGLVSGGKGPSRRENSLKIVAPTPIKATESLSAKNMSDIDYQSPSNSFDGVFKIPALPRSLSARERPDRAQVEAHIPTETVRSGMDSRIGHRESEFHTRTASRQAMRSPDTSGTSATLLDDSLDLSLDSVANFKLPGPVAGRVSLSGGQDLRSFSVQNSPTDYVSPRQPRSEDPRAVQLAGQKRHRFEIDGSDDRDDYEHGPNKRAKHGSEAGEVFHHVSEMQRQGPRRDVSYGGMSDTPRQQSTLDEVLKADTETLVQQSMGEYNERVQSWRQCSSDQWEAGSKELIAQYSDILDFAMNHFIGKVKLYRSLHAKIDAHKEELEQRQEFQNAARERWQMEGKRAFGTE